MIIMKSKKKLIKNLKISLKQTNKKTKRIKKKKIIKLKVNSKNRFEKKCNSNK